LSYYDNITQTIGDIMRIVMRISSKKIIPTIETLLNFAGSIYHLAVFSQNGSAKCVATTLLSAAILG
jgi:hypothetical protein